MLNLARQRKKIEGNKKNGHYTPMNIDTGRVADHRHITKAVQEYNKMKKGNGTMMGNGFFDDIADGFKKIGHFVEHVALPVANVAEKVVPLVAGGETGAGRKAKAKAKTQKRPMDNLIFGEGQTGAGRKAKKSGNLFSDIDLPFSGVSASEILPMAGAGKKTGAGKKNTCSCVKIVKEKDGNHRITDIKTGAGTKYQSLVKKVMKQQGFKTPIQATKFIKENGLYKK